MSINQTIIVSFKGKRVLKYNTFIITGNSSFLSPTPTGIYLGVVRMDSISSIKAASLTNLSKWFSIRVLVRTMTAILHLQTVKKYVFGGHALGLNQIVFQLNDSGRKIISQIFSTNLRSDSVPEIPPVNRIFFVNIYRPQTKFGAR